MATESVARAFGDASSGPMAHATLRSDADLSQDDAPRPTVTAAADEGVPAGALATPLPRPTRKTFVALPLEPPGAGETPDALEAPRPPGDGGGGAVGDAPLEDDRALAAAGGAWGAACSSSPSSACLGRPCRGRRLSWTPSPYPLSLSFVFVVFSPVFFAPSPLSSS